MRSQLAAPSHERVACNSTFCTRTLLRSPHPVQRTRWVSGSALRGDEAWNPREEALLTELVHTRRQVDRLLDHQQTLLSLLVAGHPSLQSGGTAPMAAAPATPALPWAQANPVTAQAARPPTSSPPTQPPAASTPSTFSNPVGDLLASFVSIAGSGATNPAPAQTPARADRAASSAMDSAAAAVQQALESVAEATGVEAGQAGRQAAASSSASSPPVMTAGSLEHQLPVLARGDRSIWWMERLHVALLAQGFYSGDDDVQSATFGEGTAEALASFQKARGAPLTGITDGHTWAVLLQELPDLRSDLAVAIASGAAPAWPAGGTATARPGASAAAPTQPVTASKPAAAAAQTGASPTAGTNDEAPALPSHVAFFSSPVTAESSASRTGGLSFNPSFTPFEGEAPLPLDALDAYYASAGSATGAADGSRPPPRAAVNGQPPLMQPGDVGGFFMDTLHTALLRAGFDPSFRDVDTLTFGSATEEAVSRFQRSQHLPPTGTVDDATWALLLQREPELRSAFVRAVVFGKPEDDQLELAGTSAVTGATDGGGSRPGGSLAHSLNGAGLSHSLNGVGSHPEPQAAAQPPVERARAMLSGSPPVLCLGDDDITWVSLLHRALVGCGFYPGEDELEAWLFLDSTSEAVKTAQASAKLPETGVVDAATWSWLIASASDDGLHADVTVALGGGSHISSTNPAQPDNPSTTAATTTTTTTAAASAAGSSNLASVNASSDGSSTYTFSSSSSSSSSSAAAQAASTSEDSTSWPILMSDDGGADVAIMQGALEAAGFSCGEDEVQWWMFGDDTTNALKTFQACNGLPETGVCDSSTWLKLMGRPDATPQDLSLMKKQLVGSSSESEGINDQDIAARQKSGRVWLLGEQRWEIRPSASSDPATPTDRDGA